jgi:hypothetical protein
MEISLKTSAKTQPLHIFFDHKCKVIAGRVYDRIILNEIDIQIAQRSNLIRLHSLMHNQTLSPVYKIMIRCA